MVDRFYNGVQCSEEIDSVVSVFDVVVDSVRQVDVWEVYFGQMYCIYVGIVIVDNYQCVDIMFFQVFDSYGVDVFVVEFWEMCRIEECIVTVDYVRNVVMVQLYYMVFIQIQIVVINIYYFQIFCQCRMNNFVNCGVYVWCIIVVCQYIDFFNYDYF